jgi:hypothetical protein
MNKLAREIKKGSLRKVLYLVLFCFSFLALVPRADAALVTSSGPVLAGQRDQDLAKIKTVLEKKEVTTRLESMGVKQADVEKRLAMLNDQDIHKLATDLDKLNPGGDGWGIALVIILVVVIVLVILYYTGYLNASFQKKPRKG